MIDIDCYRLYRLSVYRLSTSGFTLSLPKKSAHFRAALRDFWRIDLIHDARHLCTRLRINGIKLMSRGISGGKQVIKFTNTSNSGRVCSFA